MAVLTFRAPHYLILQFSSGHNLKLSSLDHLNTECKGAAEVDGGGGERGCLLLYPITLEVFIQ